MNEFLAWLERNKETVAGKSLETIRDLALLANIDPIAVKHWYDRERFKRIA